MHYCIFVFADGTVLATNRSGEAGPGAQVTGMATALKLCGQRFAALNGGPRFEFNEAISVVVNCDTQAAVDRFWEKLTEGGQSDRCSWLKDRFGLSWQIFPARFMQLMRASDDRAIQGVMQALMHMDKIDLTILDRALAGLAPP